MYISLDHCPPPAAVITVILAETRLEVDELLMSLPVRKAWTRKADITEPADDHPFWVVTLLEFKPMTDMPPEANCKVKTGE